MNYMFSSSMLTQTVVYQGSMVFAELVYMLTFYGLLVELLVLTAGRIVSPIVMCCIPRPWYRFLAFLTSLIIMMTVQVVMLAKMQQTVSGGMLIAVTVTEGIHDLVGCWMVYKHRAFVQW